MPARKTQAFVGVTLSIGPLACWDFTLPCDTKLECPAEVPCNSTAGSCLGAVLNAAPADASIEPNTAGSTDAATVRRDATRRTEPIPGAAPTDETIRGGAIAPDASRPTKSATAGRDAGDRDAGSALACGGVDQPCCGGVAACESGLACTPDAQRCTRCASFQGLGSPPGYSSATASAVSGDGAVVVGWGAHASSLNRALRWAWAEKGGLTELGSLRGDPQGSSRALATSFDGTVVVGSANGPFDSAGAFIWRESSGARRLTDGAAFGVSGDGAVIVGTHDRQEAFRWDIDGAVRPLGFFATGGSVSRALAISKDGSVIVGGANYFFSKVQAPFRWTRAASFVPIDDDNAGAATGVNADGSVVVGVRSGPAGGQVFRWTTAGKVELLFPTESADRHPATDASGSVVVGNSGGRPMLWRASTGKAIPLSTALGGLVPTGWQLLDVAGVSDNGSTIVGNGSAPESTLLEPWVAVIGPQCSAP